MPSSAPWQTCGCSIVSATLVLSKLKIELGPLLRVWRVEFGWHDDGAEVEIGGGNVWQSGERNRVCRRSLLSWSLGLGGLGDATLVAVVVAHRYGYGQKWFGTHAYA